VAPPSIVKKNRNVANDAVVNTIADQPLLSSHMHTHAITMLLTATTLAPRINSGRRPYLSINGGNSRLEENLRMPNPSVTHVAFVCDKPTDFKSDDEYVITAC
jgi:hypothetical protein